MVSIVMAPLQTLIDIMCDFVQRQLTTGLSPCSRTKERYGVLPDHHPAVAAVHSGAQ